MAGLFIAAASGAATAEVRASDPPPAEFTALVKKAERALADRGMPEVIALYKEAEALALASARPTDQAFAQARHCGALWYSERPREARPMCERALALATSVGAPHAASEAERALGMLDGDLGRYESAEAHLNRAVELAKAADAPGSLSAAYVSLSVAARTQGRHTDAAAYARRALDAQEGAADLPVGARFAPRFNPSFAHWNGSTLTETPSLEEAFVTADIVMHRRGRAFTSVHRDLYDKVWSETAMERKLALRSWEQKKLRRSA